MEFEKAKHAKQEAFVWAEPVKVEETEEEIKFVADVPEDAYYKEQINTLQRKLDNLQVMYDRMLKYVEHLESERLKEKDVLEEKDAQIEKLNATILRLAIGE